MNDEDYNGSHEEHHERLERARRQMRWSLTAIGALGLFALLTFVVIVLPYAPLKVLAYEPQADEICLRDTVIVEITYEIKAGALIEEISAVPIWTVVDVEGMDTGTQSPGRKASWPKDLIIAGKTTRSGTLIRTSPHTSGTWRLSGDIEVRGYRQWLPGVPYLQKLHVNDAKIVTVLPDDDERCQEDS